jgi:hypothetical protein
MKGKTLLSLGLTGLVLGAAYVTYSQLPQIRRYIKIEKM